MKFLIVFVFSLVFTTSQQASEVVFKVIDDDICAHAERSYRFEVYEDGDRLKTVDFTFADDLRWRAQGCFSPDYTLCYDCSISEAVRIYYNEKLERSAGSISIDW
ncbi:MAG: hypothetical protein AAF740_03475 [Bacteroidota bacterium]